MLASLIHTNRGAEPVLDNKIEGSTAKARLKLDSGFRPKTELSADAAAVEGPSCTLIVAPVSLLSQWRSELVRSGESGKRPLSVLLWHGQSKPSLGAKGGVADVVITSYGTLASEHAKLQNGGRKESSPIFNGMRWYWASLSFTR